METNKKTYDLIFSDESNSNSKDLSESIQYCRDYIRLNAGTDFSYFKDYKKGTVSIYCNEDGQTVEVYDCETGDLLQVIIVIK